MAHLGHALSSRFRKACEECRRRKLKCDGGEPCRTCAERSSPCVFSQVRRRKADSPQHQELVTGTVNFNAEKLIQPFLVTHQESSLGEEVICNAFFGPSSNMSLLLNLYHLLPSSWIGGYHGGNDEITLANNCLDAFGYRRLIFPDSQHHLSSGMSMDTKIDLGLLPFSLASRFLRNYTSTLLYMLPFQPAASLERWLNELYYPGAPKNSSSAQHAVLFAALSIGTTFTEHDRWGERLFQQAKFLVNEMFGPLSSIPAIQATTLMDYAQYQWQIGRVDSAYALLGDATRRSFATGLHHASNTDRRDGSRGRNVSRTTHLSLYCYESYVCTSLGRSSSFGAEHAKNANICHEEPVLAALVSFAQVIKELHRVQNSDELTVHDLLQSSDKAQKILTRLANTLYAFSSGESIQDEAKQTTSYMLLILYHYAMLVAYRPFLALLDKTKGQSHCNEYQNEGFEASDMPNSSWLSDGVEKAVSSAKTIISLLEDISKSGLILKESSNNIQFLESACLALGYHCLLDENASLSNASYIHIGMRRIRDIACQNVISDRLSAIESVLANIDSRGTTYPHNTLLYA